MHQSFSPNSFTARPSLINTYSCSQHNSDFTKVATMSSHVFDDVRIDQLGFCRRRFLKTISGASIAAGTLGFRDLLATEADTLRRRGKSMILLWMQGGPSQFETLDPKPGTSNGGPTEAIQTSVSGIQIADNFPQVVRQHVGTILQQG